MALIFPQVGEVLTLQNITNNTAPANLILHLYTNNITPSPTDTAGTYTEANGFGYAAITLTGGSWSFTDATPSSATYPQVTFTFNGNLGNVYGYYMTQNGILLLAERFSTGPFSIVNNGDNIKITPTITAT